MKRIGQYVEEEERERVLPSELWPQILSYLFVSKRYQYTTVCKEWGLQAGLIDQSILVLKYRVANEYTSMQTSRMAYMLNMTYLDTDLTDDVNQQLARHTHHLNVLALETCRGTVPIECGSNIAKLTNLTVLDLCETAVIGQKDLECLTSLTVLNAYKYTQIEDTSLLLLTGLRVLGINNRRIREEALSVLTNLETLVINNNPWATGTTLHCLPKLKHLTFISGQTHLPSISLDRLSALESLTLKTPPYVATQFAHLTSLLSLSLQAANLMESQIFESFMKLTRLVVKDSYHIQFSRVTFGNHLSLLTNLRVLKLDDHTGSICTDETLICLTNLRTLRISSNEHITHYSLAKLTNLYKLELISQDTFNALSGDTLPYSIRKLNLRNCAEFSLLLSALNRLTALETLTLDTVNIACLLSTDEWYRLPVFKSLKTLWCTPIGCRNYKVEIASIKQRIRPHLPLLHILSISHSKVYLY